MVPPLELVAKETHTYRTSDCSCVALPHKYLDWLQDYASLNNVKQARICFHQSNHSSLQHMLVYHHKDHFVKPHVHATKSESLIIIRGSATLLLYSETLEIKKEIPLYPNQSVYIPSGTAHSLKIHNDLLFEEITTGPFDKNSTTALLI